MFVSDLFQQDLNTLSLSVIHFIGWVNSKIFAAAYLLSLKEKKKQTNREQIYIIHSLMIHVEARSEYNAKIIIGALGVNCLIVKNIQGIDIQFNPFYHDNNNDKLEIIAKKFQKFSCCPINAAHNYQFFDCRMSESHRPLRDDFSLRRKMLLRIFIDTLDQISECEP